MTEKNSETLTLDEKLILLAKVAAGKKGVISSEELMNYFKDDQLSPEQLDYVYEFLDSHKIDVLNTDESDDSAPEFFVKDDDLDEEETEETDKPAEPQQPEKKAEPEKAQEPKKTRKTKKAEA